jgi:hypothetical protein
MGRCAPSGVPTGPRCYAIADNSKKPLGRSVSQKIVRDMRRISARYPAR